MNPLEKLIQAIIVIAKSYLGQKEKPNNSGFLDPGFEAKMRAQGWRPGYAWCAIFTRLVWIEAYQQLEPAKVSVLAKLFSPGVLATYNQFKTAGKTVTTPQPGDVVIFRHGRTVNGHAGIVIEVGPGNRITTIEGNTNAEGGREGDRVAVKSRKLNQPFQEHGLNLVGFVRPF